MVVESTTTGTGWSTCRKPGSTSNWPTPVPFANTTGSNTPATGRCPAPRTPAAPGILPTGTILPPAHRAVRDLAAKRLQLVRSRAATFCHRKHPGPAKGARINSNQIKRLTLEDVTQWTCLLDVCLAIQSNLAVIMTLNTQIELLEKRLQENIGDRPGTPCSPAFPVSVASSPSSRSDRTDRTLYRGGQLRLPTPAASTSQRISSNKKKGETTPEWQQSTSPGPLLKRPTALRFCAEAKRFLRANEQRQTMQLAAKALAHKAGAEPASRI